MMCKGGAKSLPRRLSICHFETSFWFLTSARQEHRLRLVTGTDLGSNLELARRTSYEVVNNLHQLFFFFFNAYILPATPREGEKRFSGY